MPKYNQGDSYRKYIAFMYFLKDKLSEIGTDLGKKTAEYFITSITGEAQGPLIIDLPKVYDKFEVAKRVLLRFHWLADNDVNPGFRNYRRACIRRWMEAPHYNVYLSTRKCADLLKILLNLITADNATKTLEEFSKDNMSEAPVVPVVLSVLLGMIVDLGREGVPLVVLLLEVFIKNAKLSWLLYTTLAYLIWLLKQVLWNTRLANKIWTRILQEVARQASVQNGGIIH